MLKIKQKGFDMIQVILIIALFLALTAIAVPSLRQFQTSNQLDTAVTELVQNLRRAQSKAITGLQGDAWGVYFAEQNYTIFAGTDWNSHDNAADEVYILPGGFNLTTDFGNQLIWSAINGRPINFGNITLSNSAGASEIITINQAGIIDYR
ncbi:MAG: GspH/FimT family pseudopilin [Candidatus Komeilibacteria bacterium]